MMPSRPPAVVIVARHGARLDAADKQWHLTSPTPYDPPLTYGGWTQCRALGARIASLLQAREEFSEGPKDTVKGQETSKEPTKPEAQEKKTQKVNGKRRKHKIIIHSSPFLRCIQTSVAISAGISQYQGQQEQIESQTVSKKSTLSLEPPKANPGFSASPLLSAIPDEEIKPGPTSNATSAKSHLHLKPKLRVDAFLGEWLSPDYYENITPPPGSIMMVAGAKADLLRRGEYIETSEDSSTLASTQGNFPGGWSLSIPGTPEPDQEMQLVDKFANVGLKSPRRDRASTLASSVSRSPEDSHALRATPTMNGYIPPIPRYAISPSDPIPNGYVHHARDACIEVDYQWDSMRDPQGWGDGGDYGEEWGHMHKRFRRGLSRMIDWYRIHHETANQVGGHKRVLHPHPSLEDDQDTDTVLIIVSHGAGCNALIGALTNQPVLMDVSMASLTMALRKEDRPQSPVYSEDHKSSPHSPGYTRHSDFPLSATYHVELTASTDHLHAASSSQPLTVPLLANQGKQSTASSSSNSITSAPGPRVAPRRNTRHDSLPKTISPFSPPDSPAPSHHSAASSVGLHRSSSAAASHRSHHSAGLERSNSGLWSAPGSEEKPRRTWTMGQTDAAAERDRFNSTSSTVAGMNSGGPLALWGSKNESAVSSGTLSGAQTPEREKIGRLPELGPLGSSAKPGLNAVGMWGPSLWGDASNEPRSPAPDAEPTFPGAPLPSAPTSASLPSATNETSTASGGLFSSPVTSPGISGGLWGASVKSGLPRPGMSAMAMALRGDEGVSKQEPENEEHRGREEEGESREREVGAKRRWTVNDREIPGSNL